MYSFCASALSKKKKKPESQCVDILPYQTADKMSPSCSSVELLTYVVKWIKTLTYLLGCFAMHISSDDFWHLQNPPKTHRTLGKRNYCLSTTFKILTPRVTKLFFVLFPKSSIIHFYPQQQGLAWSGNTSSVLQSHTLCCSCIGQARLLSKEAFQGLFVPRRNQTMATLPKKGL